MDSVIQAVDFWDSPRLYEIDGARARCLEILKAHRFADSPDRDFRYADWDFTSEEAVDLIDMPPFDPDNPDHASVPRLIFAKTPHVVRVFRGTVYDTMTHYLLSIAAGDHWTCDWGTNGPHEIRPQVYENPDNGERSIIQSNPYVMTKAMGEYLVAFIMCSLCLDDVIARSQQYSLSGANAHDRELIDGQWKPRWFNPQQKMIRFANGPHKQTVWDSNTKQFPAIGGNNLWPAAYQIDGITFIVPQSFSQWRDVDDRRYDSLL